MRSGQGSLRRAAVLAVLAAALALIAVRGVARREAAVQAQIGAVGRIVVLVHDVPQGHAIRPDDIAYLQYSSGSTRFPHGVAITHEGLLNNLAAHSHGMEVVETDRCVSWLPWYHDMGLVGCFLTPVANQVSTD